MKHICIIGIFLLLCSCSPPERNLTVRQIRALDNFTELMWTMATVADSRFALAKELEEGQMTDAQFAEFIDMGKRLQVAAQRLADFSKGAEFDEIGSMLATNAGNIQKMAKAKNASQTIELANRILNNCKSCHKQYR